MLIKYHQLIFNLALTILYINMFSSCTTQKSFSNEKIVAFKIGHQDITYKKKSNDDLAEFRMDTSYVYCFVKGDKRIIQTFVNRVFYESDTVHLNNLDFDTANNGDVNKSARNKIKSLNVIPKNLVYRVGEKYGLLFFEGKTSKVFIDTLPIYHWIIYPQWDSIVQFAKKFELISDSNHSMDGSFEKKYIIETNAEPPKKGIISFVYSKKLKQSGYSLAPSLEKINKAKLMQINTILEPQKQANGSYSPVFKDYRFIEQFTPENLEELNAQFDSLNSIKTS